MEKMKCQLCGDIFFTTITVNRGGSSKNKRYACKVRFRSLLQPISKTPKWAQKSSKSFSRLTT